MFEKNSLFASGTKLQKVYQSVLTSLTANTLNFKITKLSLNSSRCDNQISIMFKRQHHLYQDAFRRMNEHYVARKVLISDNN